MADIVVRNPDRPGTYLLPWGAEPREPAIHPGRIWGVVRRHLLLILGCVAVVVAAVVFFTLQLTPVYQASATIQITERQSGQTSPLDILQKLTTGSQVETEMEVLGTRTLAEAVVDSLRLQLQLAKPTGVPRDELFADIKVARDAPPASYRLVREPDSRLRLEDGESGASLGVFAAGDRVQLPGASFALTPTAAQYEEIGFGVQEFDEAVDALRGAVDVSRPSRDADIVAVTYEGTDPRLVRDVPNVLTARFIAQRQHVGQTEARSMVRFLRQQLDTISAQLAKAEGALRAFREGEKVVSPEAEANSQVSAAAELQAERSRIEAERAALARLLDSTRAAATRRRPGDPSPYRDLFAFPTLLRNQAAATLLNSLATIEDRRAELLSRRSLQDPDVQVLTRRVEEIENQLRSLTTTYLQSLGSQVASLDAALARQQQQLARIPRREQQFAQLQREPEVLQETYKLLQSRLKEAEIAQAVEDPSVRLVDAATLPRDPVRPNPMLNLILGLATGLLLGISAAFAREYMDRSVHTRGDVQAATGIPVLGLIPRVQRTGWAARIRGRGRDSKHIGPARSGNGNSAHVPDALSLDGASGGLGGALLAGIDPRSPIAEAYNRLETNVAFARQDGTVKTLVLTSPLPGDGKTTVAVNLAITLAQRGQRVLLIDADLRRGVINTLLGSRREPGLSNVLLGTVTFRDAVRKVDVGEGATLHFLTTGKLPPNPAHLLASSRPRTLLDSLAAEYETIILDTPPLNVVTDAALLGASSDGVVLVARSGVTAPEALGFAMEQLRSVRAPVLGAILNDIDFNRDATYDTAYRYYGHDVEYYAKSP